MNLFKFGLSGSKVHGTWQDSNSTARTVTAFCGKRETAGFERWERNVRLVAEEDLCGTCFPPFRVAKFHAMRDQARRDALDPIDSLDVHEARDALKRLRRKVEGGELVDESDFKKCLHKPVSGTLTITVDLFNLDPKVRDFGNGDFLDGFVEEVYTPLSHQWSTEQVDLCWWTPEAKEGDFEESAQVASVEFEPND